MTYDETLKIIEEFEELQPGDPKYDFARRRALIASDEFEEENGLSFKVARAKRRNRVDQRERILKELLRQFQGGLSGGWILPGVNDQSQNDDDDDEFDPGYTLPFEIISKDKIQTALSDRGALIIANRQSGKTSELLKYMRQERGVRLLVPTPREVDFAVSREPSLRNRIYTSNVDPVRLRGCTLLIDDLGRHQPSHILDPQIFVAVQAAICSPMELGLLKSYYKELYQIPFVRKIYVVQD